MCDGLGRQFSYSCPNTTLFQQRMFICDHWYMVNCSRSEIDYTANLLIGQNKPFVDDSDKQTYYRTPRPDLLTEPTASEINLIYRASRAQNRTDLNLVGVDTDFDQNNGSSIVTDKPAYHLPSHWSTEYSKSTPSTVVSDVDVSVNKPFVNVDKELIGDRESVSQPSVRRSTLAVPIPVAKSINFNSNNLDNTIKLKPTNNFLKKDVSVNYKSSFKATTPVFPTKDELVTTESPIDDILNPPTANTPLPAVNHNDKPEITVNFNSLFKATTPVFPTIEELGTTEKSLNDILKPPRSNGESAVEDDIFITPNRNSEPAVKPEAVVNFKSLFKATTPVYPTKEELGTTESPVDDILQPPGSSDDKQISSLPGLDIQPPSLLFEAPALGTEQSVTGDNKYTSKNSKGKNKIATRLSNEKVLKELRKMFSIPDYEFPLDTVSRPGYEQNVDSFNTNPFLADVVPRQHAFA